MISVLSATARGQPQIQQFLEQMEDCRPSLLYERADTAEPARIGPFSQAILEEAGFVSYSEWHLTCSGSEQEFQILELTDPLGAYELFTLWPHLKPEDRGTYLELPVGNQFNPKGSLFWRGNFLIRVSPAGEQLLAESDFANSVNRFTSAISAENLLPVTVTNLPDEGRIPGSVQFYLGAASLGLNSQFPEPLRQEIGLDERIEIACARYGPDERPLFLIGYPTHDLAEDYAVRLQDRMQDLFAAGDVHLKRTGILLAVIVGPRERAQEILARVNYTLTIKWLYEKVTGKPSKTMTFLGLIATSILGTGVLVLMILGVGIVAGLVRYETFKRFPGLSVRNRTIRLDLERREKEITREIAG
jgi:hypothetical protein